MGNTKFIHVQMTKEAIQSSSVECVEKERLPIFIDNLKCEKV
jgi:hypothetical protein